MLAIGYGLNVLRAILPYLIKWWLTQWPGYLILMWKVLIYVDILQFAGLTLIMFGLLKMTRQCYLLATLVGASYILLNFAALNIQTSNYVASALTGLVWGSNAASYFPFLTWSFYPLSGFLFGALLIRCRDKRRFYAITLSAATLLVVILAVLAVVWELDIGLSSDYTTIITPCWAISFSPLLWWAGSVCGIFSHLGYPTGPYTYCCGGATM